MSLMRPQHNEVNDTKEQTKRIVVVGQGAMGLLWYHHLSELSKKNKQLEVTLKPSSRFNYDDNSYLFTPYQPSTYQQAPSSENSSKKIKEPIAGLINYADSVSLKQADVVIFCLKAYQVGEAINELCEFLPQGVTLVLAHNGMGTLDSLSEAVRSKCHIASMLSTHGCLRSNSISNSNTVTHTGLGESTIGMVSFAQLSETDSKPDSERNDVALNNLKGLVVLLNNALPCVNYTKNIIEKQWLKLAVNCVINPITAIDNIENGLVNSVVYLDKKHALINEIIEVAKFEGVTLHFELLADTVTKVAEATAKNSSSMRCDVQERRQTEIDYINGYIHALGLKNNIATPMNTLMWQQVLAK